MVLFASFPMEAAAPPTLPVLALAAEGTCFMLLFSNVIGRSHCEKKVVAFGSFATNILFSSHFCTSGVT